MAMCVIAVVGAAPCQCFLTGREPYDVARLYGFDRTAPTLCAARSGGDDQRLSQRMGVPRGSGSRLEGDMGADGAGGVRRLEQRIDAYSSREVLRRSLPRGL
jgi:hypothetical protein